MGDCPQILVLLPEIIPLTYASSDGVFSRQELGASGIWAQVETSRAGSVRVHVLPELSEELDGQRAVGRHHVRARRPRAGRPPTSHSRSCHHSFGHGLARRSRARGSLNPAAILQPWPSQASKILSSLLPVWGPDVGDRRHVLPRSCSGRGQIRLRSRGSEIHEARASGWAVNPRNQMLGPGNASRPRSWLYQQRMADLSKRLRSCGKQNSRGAPKAPGRGVREGEAGGLGSGSEKGVGSRGAALSFQPWGAGGSGGSPP